MVGSVAVERFFRSLFNLDSLLDHVLVATAVKSLDLYHSIRPDSFCVGECYFKGHTTIDAVARTVACSLV